MSCLIFTPQQGLALPSGGRLVAGDVTATQNGFQLTLDQASRAAIMNWRSFDIASGELVRVLQPGSDAALLARVTGGNPTELLGRIQADGKLFLINPKGILVGQGAVIDTAAFLASTLDVADTDFLKQGALAFQGGSTAGVVNLGRITAREGNVLLLAHTVKNAGEITAPHGTVGLAAGTEVYLASPDTPAFVVKTNLAATTEKTGVDNSGTIAAAQAQLEAAGGSIYDLAVNQSGTIRATGVEHLPDGRVLLTAGGGNVAVTGAVSARDANGAGGEILVGGDYQGKNPAVANAARTYIGPAARLDASAASVTGDGGRVVVWADGTTRFAGALEAKAGQRGGNGGFAEVSGKQSLAFAGTADLSAPAGARGELLLDPTNVTIVAGTTALPSQLTDVPYSWDESADPGDHTLGADNLTSLLATTSVTVRATDSITVDAPVIVAGGGAAGVKLTLGASSLTINQTVSLANVTNGQLELLHGLSGPGTSLTSAASATLTAAKIRIGEFPITTLNGTVTSPDLEFNSLSGVTSFIATNPANTINKLTIVDDPANPNPINFSGSVAVASSSAMTVQALISSATNVTLSAGGDLTLLGTDGFTPATSMTVSGTTKLASTGGVFINQAGAGVLAGAGRRLLYTSAATGAFSLDGLTGYTQVNAVAYPDDPQSGTTLVVYNGAGSSPGLTLTITANDFIKLYGQADPTFTASYAGGTAADLTALPTFSIAQGAHVNVGTYTIVPAGATSATHSLTYVNGTLTIDPATLTYVATPVSRLYGDANPAFSGTVTGFVNGDTVGSATTGTLAFTSPAAAGSDVGTYAVDGGGLTANNGNYVFTQAGGNSTALTVNRAPLAVVFNNASRVYGDTNPALTASFTGLRNGDTAATLAGYAPSVAAFDWSPIGTYEIGAPNTLTNYDLTVTPATLTITPAPLAYTVNDATREYGLANPAFSFTVSGLRSWDLASDAGIATYSTAATQGSTIGGYAINAAISGVGSNYTVTSVTPGTLTVSRAPLNLTAISLNTVYGDPLPALGYTVSGLRNGDSSDVLSGVEFDLIVTGSPSPGAYSYGFFSTGTAQNYAVTRTVPGVLNVARRPIDITVGNAAWTQGYGPLHPVFSVTSAAPAAAGPQFTVSGGTTARINSPTGTYAINAVIQPGSGLSRQDLDAYYDFRVTPGTLTISDAEIVATNINVDRTVVEEKTKELIDPEKIKASSKVVVGLNAPISRPLTSAEMSAALRDFGPDLLKQAKSMLADKSSLSALTAEQRARLEEFAAGKLSADDATLRVALMPVLAAVTVNAITSGQPLTFNQKLLVGRLATNMNKQRETLAQELQTEFWQYQKTKAAVGVNNPFSLKTMPDIAKSAQQAAAERAMAAAIGAGAGLAIGAAAGTAIGLAVANTVAAGAHAALMTAELTGTAVSGGSAATIGAGVGAAAGAGAAAMILAAVVVGVVGTVMVIQEGENRDAYKATLARAQTKVDQKFTGVDLKNDAGSQTDFYVAFMMTMSETGGGSSG